MARGRYGKAAAQRRAASAEEQLDRLVPQLTDAKRTAVRYKAEAEAAVALRAELAKLRDTVGVPVAEHEETVAQLQRRHRQAMSEVETSCANLFDEFARWVVVEDEANWISGRLMETLQAVPRPIADGFLRCLGVERELARFLLNGDPNRVSRDSETHHRVMQLALKAREVDGLSDWRIPVSYLNEDKSNERHRGRRLDRRPEQPDVAECTATMLDAVRAFAARRGHDSDEHAIGPLLMRVYDARGALCSARRREREDAEHG
jgi:regulator of replication initiation timing